MLIWWPTAAVNTGTSHIFFARNAECDGECGCGQWQYEDCEVKLSSLLSRARATTCWSDPRMRRLSLGVTSGASLPVHIGPWSGQHVTQPRDKLRDMSSLWQQHVTPWHRHDKLIIIIIHILLTTMVSYPLPSWNRILSLAIPAGLRCVVMKINGNVSI